MVVAASPPPTPARILRSWIRLSCLLRSRLLRRTVPAQQLSSAPSQTHCRLSLVTPGKQFLPGYPPRRGSGIVRLQSHRQRQKSFTLNYLPYPPSSTHNVVLPIPPA